MGLPIPQAMDLTPRQFQNYLEGFLEAREAATKLQWEQTRVVCFYAAAGNLKKSATDPGKLFSFPWEQTGDPVDAKSLEEQAAEMKAFWDNIDQKRGKSGS